MAALRTMADGNIKFTVMTAEPADLDSLTSTELSAGIDAECHLAKSGTRISASTSNTISEARLCDEIEAKAFGASNYEGQMTIFWKLDPDTGAYVEADNPVFEVVSQKNAKFWIAIRKGPKADQPWAANDLYSAYEVRCDEAQEPSSPEGYIKMTVPLQVDRAATHKRVAA